MQPPVARRSHTINDATCAEFCTFSNLGYTGSITSALHKHGYWCEIITCEDSRLFYAGNGQQEVICFLNDPVLAEIIKPKYYSIRYWRGVDVYGPFLTHYKLIRAALIARVRQSTENKGSKVERWITGHGQGGATAQLFGYDLATRKLQAEHLVTFGAPMVGRDAWVDCFNHHYRDKARRYAYCADPVPHQPAAEKGLQQTGNLKFIDESGRINDRPDQWRRLPGEEPPQGNLEEWPGHDISVYCENLNKRQEQ